MGAPLQVREGAARGRCDGRARERRTAGSAPVEVSQRAVRVGVAVGFPGDAVLRGFGDGRTAPASPARVGSATCGQGRRSSRRHPSSGHLSFAAALICDAPARSGLRHQNNPGVARASGREYDDDLHARAQPRWAWGTESARSTGAGPRSVMDAISSAASREYFAIEFCISPQGMGQHRAEMMIRMTVALLLKSPASRDTLRPHKWCRAIEFGRLIVGPIPELEDQE